MSEPAWMVKVRAREALTNGRPDIAHALLDELVAAGDRKTWALRGDVVRGYVDRAEKSLRRDDAEAAWADLNRVATLCDPADGAVASCATRSFASASPKCRRN